MSGAPQPQKEYIAALKVNTLEAEIFGGFTLKEELNGPTLRGKPGTTTMIRSPGTDELLSSTVNLAGNAIGLYSSGLGTPDILVSSNVVTFNAPIVANSPVSMGNFNIQYEAAGPTIRGNTGTATLLRSPGPLNELIYGGVTSSTVALSGGAIGLWSGLLSVPEVLVTGSGVTVTGNTVIAGDLTVTGTLAVPPATVSYQSPFYTSLTDVTVLSTSVATTSGATTHGSVRVKGAATGAPGVALFDGASAAPTLEVHSGKVIIGDSTRPSMVTTPSSRDLTVNTGSGGSTKLILATQANTTDGIAASATVALQGRDIKLYSGIDATPTWWLKDNNVIFKGTAFACINIGDDAGLFSETPMRWPVSTISRRVISDNMVWQTSPDPGFYDGVFCQQEGFYEVSVSMRTNILNASDRFKITVNYNTMAESTIASWSQCHTIAYVPNGGGTIRVQHVGGSASYYRNGASFRIVKIPGGFRTFETSIGTGVTDQRLNQ